MPAFSKTHILNAMHDRTKRTDITDIDVELAAIMLDLSNRHPFLEKSTTVTIDASATNKALPSDYRRPIRAVTDPNEIPLSEIDFPKWTIFRVGSTADAAAIKHWAMFNDLLYVHPSPAGSTVLTVYHSYVSDDVGDIPFNKDFKEACIVGVCWKIYARIDEFDRAQSYEKTYETQVQVLQKRYAGRVTT